MTVEHQKESRKVRYFVENTLTDKRLGTFEAETPQAAIDAAYQARGWQGFEDAKANNGTAAEPDEIVATQIDADGHDTGPERLARIREWSFLRVGTRPRLCLSDAQRKEMVFAYRAWGWQPVSISWDEAEHMVEPRHNGIRLYKTGDGALPVEVSGTAVTPADFRLMREAGLSASVSLI